MNTASMTLNPRDLSIPMTNVGFWSYIRAYSITVWFFLLTLNLWWLQVWDSLINLMEEGANLKYYYYVGMSIAAVFHLTLGLKAWAEAPIKFASTVPGKLFTLYCILMLVLAVQSDDPATSAVYAAASLFVFSLCTVAWLSGYWPMRSMFLLTGFVLIAWIGILAIHHGQPRGFGTEIGGINRNVLCKLVLVSMACLGFSNKALVRWGGIAFALFVALLVNSRGAMVAWFFYMLVYCTLTYGISNTVKIFLGMMILGFVSLIAIPEVRNTVFEIILKLSDESRGLGTGLTGRFEQWQIGIKIFFEDPFFGTGFRTSQGLNSGYIKIFVESGFIGGIMVVAAAAIEIYRRFKVALNTRNTDPRLYPRVNLKESNRLNSIACATITSTIILWVYEPIYMNLGTVTTLLFYLFFAAPTFVQTDYHPRSRYRFKR